MSKSEIIILTGSTGSGKTSWLQQQFLGKEKTYGILTPIVTGKRVFVNLATNESFAMEASNESDVFYVGRYCFSKIAFDKAQQIMFDALTQPVGTIIVDEVGPLELRKEGFYESVKSLFANDNPALKKLLVVREQLLAEVINTFAIVRYQLIRPTPFPC